jgi:hypothetical protein
MKQGLVIDPWVIPGIGNSSGGYAVQSCDSPAGLMALPATTDPAAPADDRNVSCLLMALFSRALTRMNTARQDAIDVLPRRSARAGTGP